MKIRFSLRYRVALSFLLLGWLVSMLMGGILYTLTIRMEEDLIEETLSIELEDYMQRYSLDPKARPPLSSHIQGFAITLEERESYPDEIRLLGRGLRHLKIGNSGFYADSRELGEVRFVVLYADEFIKTRESQYLGFLALGIMFITLLSSFLGLWLAGRVNSPVISLARRVSEMGLDAEAIPMPEKLPRDEVGELAMAIDGYRSRLAAFVSRERAFTSDVSHELRTPLAVIEGASEVLLTDEDLNPDKRKKVERIARAANQITRLTAALLALAREESDKTNVLQCPVDKVLTKVVDEHLYLLNHKSVEVKLEADSDLEISADSVLLYVVLANIVRNAFSYTHEGTVHINLQGSRVLIQDTGAGISDEQLEKIFERYYRGTDSKTGHGIGMSLVQRICERYGWRIAVSSDKGTGTTVELILDSKPD